MKKKLLGAFFALATIFSSQAQNVRVLGYFPQYRATSGTQYDKLTDLAYSFINPNDDGSLKTDGYSTDQLFGFDANKFVITRDACANAGTNLWIALGGADDAHARDSRLNSVSADPDQRNLLATDLVAFCILHGVYGIAVDWEFPDAGTEVNNHVLLLEAINAKIDASSNTNIQVAVAVGAEYTGSVNHLNKIHTDLFGSKAHLVDDWHVMAYDFPSSYGTNHSSVASATGSMDAWKNKGMDYSKMLLGVPFYGRNANRTGEIEYNNLTGTAATNYSSDLSSGWYYNGKTTLEAKIDLAVSKGALGILIWDLGQDRPAGDYSLLDAIDVKVKTVCPIAKPNLGADKGVCAPNSVTLDPGVTGSGLQFTWTKDGGSSISSATTYDVSTAGTYKVSITDGACTKTDEIIIVSGSSITTTGDNGCDDENLTLSVNSPDGTKTYKWYDQASSGQLLATGTSYTEMFATSTTVYVEEAAAGVNNYTSSVTEIPQTPKKYHAWAGTAYTFRCAQMLVVDTDLKLKSLRLIASKLNGCTFNVKIIDAANAPNFTDVADLGPFTSPAEPGAPASAEYYFDFDLNYDLAPGTYFVYVEPATGDEGNYGVINGHTEESTESGVYTIKGSTFQAGEMDNGYPNFAATDEGQSWWSAYGPFLNWKFETGANASCGRTAATATVVNCGPPEIKIVSPSSTGQYYTQAPLIDFEANVTDGGSITSVVFEVYNGTTLVATLPTNSSGSTYTATWQANNPGTDYEFKVIATDNDNNVENAYSDFDVDADVSAQDVIMNGDLGVYPNPATDEFSISFDLVSTSDVSVEVVNSVGSVVYYQEMGSLKGTQLIKVNTDLGVGLYFVNLKVGNEVATTPLNVVK
jgi:GH18 family chitinase